MAFGECIPEVCGSRLRISSYSSPDLPAEGIFGRHRSLSTNLFIDVASHPDREVTLFLGDGRRTELARWSRPVDGVPPAVFRIGGYRQDWPGASRMFYGAYKEPPAGWPKSRSPEVANEELIRWMEHDICSPSGPQKFMLTRVENPGGRDTVYHYDESHGAPRLECIELPDGRCVRFEYAKGGDRGNWWEVAPPPPQEDAWLRRADDRRADNDVLLAAVVDWNGGRTTFHYDADRGLRAIRQPSGYVTGYDVDGRFGFFRQVVLDAEGGPVGGIDIWGAGSSRFKHYKRSGLIEDAGREPVSTGAVGVYGWPVTFFPETP
jgi:hypothetical protein